MFKPSEKQIKAIKNMAEGLNLGYEGRKEFFSTFSEFQEYFEYLLSEMKKLKKKINFDKANKNGKIDFKKIKEKKEKYYRDNINKLIEKVGDYKGRYNPSKRKIEEFIKKKIDDKEIIKEVIEALEVDDASNIRNRIKNMRKNLKSFFEIKGKLFEKLFEKEQIENILYQIKEEELNAEEVDTDVLNKIKYKIELYQKQGKSKMQVKQKLYGSLQNNSELNRLIESVFSDDLEEDLLEKEINKFLFRNPKIDQQKLIDKFIRKGFFYGKIKEILNKIVYNNSR